jgi:ATP adenylyltransferase
MQMLSAADKADKPAKVAESPKPAAAAAPPATSSSFFREYFLNNTPESDAKNHVIVRTAPKPDADNLAGLVLLNKYPYANGHLLIALGDPRPRLLDYSPQQRAELWRLTDLAVELCEKTLMPQGVNVGLNQSTAAGAGVPQHVHVHVVPRWVGDVNFITVVGQVRVIPGALDDMYKRYREVWEGMNREH